MTSVKDSPFSLKDYQEINGYYNYYINRLNIIDPDRLASIYPPLYNSQILFMLFVKEFIKGEKNSFPTTINPLDYPHPYFINNMTTEEREERELHDKETTAQNEAIRLKADYQAELEKDVKNSKK